MLGTPSLSNAISDVKHIFHEYELTDHASSNFSIDFAPTNKGSGVIQHYLKIQIIKALLITQLGLQLLMTKKIKKVFF